MITVTLYARKNDAACDAVRADLAALEAQLPHRLVEVDIDSDPALQKKYEAQIPVLAVGPYMLAAPITRAQIQVTLRAASDRRDQLEAVGDTGYAERVRRGAELSQADKVSFWLSRHYLALLNLVVALYVGLPFLAPTLMKSGAEAPARALYTIYSPLCHQFAFRSFFLFGEQPYYPLPEAGLKNIKTLDLVTGFQNLEDPGNISRLQARQFIGNEQLGYKVALCERDVAIYGAMLLFGLLYAATGRRLPALHWIAWFLIALGPIGLDGFSQLFSQFNFSWLSPILPYRESTPFLRVLTGSLFGFCTAWFSYPYLEESMAETRQFFIKKFAAVTGK